MKKVFVIIATLMVSLCAFAQETNKDADGKTQYGPYETNKFFDNWFIDAGAGVNFSLKGQEGLHNGKGLDLEFNLGKWIEPCYGFRFGWQGFTNGDVMVSDQKFGDIQFNYLHTDFMVNISNLFGGYKEKRTISFVPYVTAGAAFQKTMKEHRSFAYGAGLQMPIRLGGVVSIVPEAQLLGLRGTVLNAKEGVSGVFTASLGFRFNLGKNNWTRKATTVGAAAAALAASEAALAAAKDQNAKLAADAANSAKALEELRAQYDALMKNLKDCEESKKAPLVDLSENPLIVYFPIGKATLPATELAHFEYDVKSTIINCPNAKLTICGMADAKTGNKALNEKLSKKRAEYIKNLLVETYGLDPDRFELTTFVGNASANPELDRAASISAK